ncbi:MAG: pilus assembly protein TadG-related protein, partial [Hyphomicrobiaceae bacterium]
MRRQPQQFPKRQRGAVAVVVGLAILVLLGMIGLALDMGQMFVNKTELQNAADACALAAARELDGNADALTRADAAGVKVGTQNLVGFQKTAVVLTPADISYSDQLSPNSSYTTSAATSAGEAKKARFAMCQVGRTDIAMWFMGLQGFGNQTVRAYAVATLAPSQTTCAIPVGMCEANGSAPTFGLVVGQWYSGKFSAGTPGSTGSYDWIDFNPASRSLISLAPPP